LRATQNALPGHMWPASSGFEVLVYTSSTK